MIISIITKEKIMKTIKHEVKLERSVKIILGTFAFGIILNAFLTPAGQELFGIKEAKAEWSNDRYNPVYIDCVSGCK